MIPETPTIVLIGPASSGSKLVRDLIAQHPAVSAVPYDINFIWKKGLTDLGHDEVPASHYSDKNAQYVRRYLARYAAPSTPEYVLEKTNATGLRLPLVERIFPQARYIHLRRNVYDVVHSARRRWQESPGMMYGLRKASRMPLDALAPVAWKYLRSLLSGVAGGRLGSWGQVYEGMTLDLAECSLLEVCARQYARVDELALQYCSRKASHECLTLNYESLVQHPAETVKSVWAWLGLRIQDVPISVEHVSTEKVNSGGPNLSVEEKALVDHVRAGERERARRSFDA